jgi:septal ring factor EnvC (AmiA/AmiB activator)
MTRATKLLAVLAVTLLGLWGCAKAPTVASGDAERIKALEAKNARLEDDFRTAANMRDQLKKKLAAAELQQTQMRQELEQLQETAKQCEELRQTLVVRTTERDALHAQFDQFRKGIRNLLGETDAALSHPTPAPVTSTVEARNPGQL